jgi:hypothetical protein
MNTNVVAAGADALVVRRSSRKTFLLFLANLGITAAFIFLIFYPVPRMSSWGAIAGTVMFGAATGLLLWTLMQGKEEILTITPEGIRDRRLSPDFIPWRVVERVDAQRLDRLQKAVVLTPREGWTPRLIHLSASPLRVDHASGLSGVVIGLTGLERHPDELLATIARYHARYGVH